MDWREEGTLLTVRRHGESAAIIDVFTATRGRHAGVVRGGAGRRLSAVLQPGAQLDLTWRGRLEDQLGSFTVEPKQSRSAGVRGDRLALAGLNALTALLAFLLPEREPHPRLYAMSVSMFDALETEPDWPLAYLHWELALLEELGFGLDLSSCAITGSRDDLAFVSPRTGRAVARDAAGDWADRLLPLPLCMLGQGPATLSELLAGLSTTGHFLENRIAPAMGDRPLPPARHRLIETIARLR
ncbi:DNA repair protein RecO [Mesobaculum littorinae]|uniref:DNA repair protein RecO n=1 Tax=Mesobaculum littorinae TaxID=2486419 RepID=A0A438ADH0_9RHOB|nr:DNA repair protein RecO [Mesobaculum littorinae]RVV96729.1 DNA repair protein RecO [Mesobaculum littorinae]